MIRHYPIRKLILHGVIGGLIAGAVFAAAQIVVTVLLGGNWLTPIRLFASIGLGTVALDAVYPLVNVLVVGLLIHAILSAGYGVAFFVILAAIRQIGNTRGMLLFYGSLYGLLLWVTNFYWTAPLYFPQFLELHQVWHGVVAHTFFFGTVLGAYTAAVKPARWVEKAIPAADR
ncbi:MAG: hypothetical protein CL610_17460 [Anaerolineaceae bacterium]|nr:hypothetical protein [Anaerolineaceae bacterium]